MLFTKSFALPAAILAGASFAFAQQGGAVPQPSKDTLRKADPILKSARKDILLNQLSLTSIITVQKPAVPDVDKASQLVSGILNILNNVEMNLTAPASDVSFNPTGTTTRLPTVEDESVILSDFLNSLVPTAKLVLSLNGNPLSQTIDQITSKMLDVLKLCSDRLHVTFNLTIRKHLVTENALDNITPGFTAIATYLKGNVYPHLP